MIGQPVTIRIELDHLKQNIVTALHDYDKSLEKSMQEQLESTIQNFNFESYITPIVNQAIQEAVNTYFKYGNGRKIIETVVSDALDKIFSFVPKEDE